MIITTRAQRRQAEGRVVSLARWNMRRVDDPDWNSWANLDQGDLALVEQDLAGRRCRMQPRDNGWTIDLDDGRTLMVSVPWRIVSDGHIAFGGRDDGNRFGLARPLDGKAETRLLVGGKRLAAASVSRQTADLSLCFEDATRIDVFNDSSGYEGWRIRCRIRDRWVWVIGSGGGQIRVVFIDH